MMWMTIFESFLRREVLQVLELVQVQVLELEKITRVTREKCTYWGFHCRMEVGQTTSRFNRKSNRTSTLFSLEIPEKAKYKKFHLL